MILGPFLGGVLLLGVGEEKETEIGIEIYGLCPCRCRCRCRFWRGKKGKRLWRCVSLVVVHVAVLATGYLVVLKRRGWLYMWLL